MGQAALLDIQAGDPMFAQLAGPPDSDEDCRKRCEIRAGYPPAAADPGAPLTGVKP
jgi:hypothetical protein